MNKQCEPIDVLLIVVNYKHLVLFLLLFDSLAKPYQQWIEPFRKFQVLLQYRRFQELSVSSNLTENIDLSEFIPHFPHFVFKKRI